MTAAVLRRSPGHGRGKRSKLRIWEEHFRKHRWSAALKDPCLACAAPMSTLERAITIAAEAHAGQTDKAGGGGLHPPSPAGDV